MRHAWLLAVLLVLGGTTQAQSIVTVSWENAGDGSSPNAVYCLAATKITINSSRPVTPTTDSRFCQTQGNPFNLPNGNAMISFPEDPLNPGTPLLLEEITVNKGAYVPVEGRTGYFSRTDTLIANSGGSAIPIWSGSTTQVYLATTVKTCPRYGPCKYRTVYSVVSGAGSITAVQ